VASAARAALTHRSWGRRWITTGLAVAAALLVCSPAALALSQRGHSFSSSFGEAVGLSGPSAVAVNELPGGEGAGDVYVLDSANNRVVRFGPAPEHAFIEAWGWGVSDGAKAFEKCTSNCRAGIAGFGKGEFKDPVAIAVDNSGGGPSQGDVYVVANRTATKAVVDKFSPSGVLVHKLISKKEEKEEVEGMITGVAVSANGTVWVERESEAEEFVIDRFNNLVKNKPLGEPLELEVPNLEGPRPVRPGFALDNQEHLYVTYEPGGKDLEELTAAPEPICQHHQCLVAKLQLGATEPIPLSLEVDEENSTGVAVDHSSETPSSNDVYVDNVTSIAALTPGGSLIQHFGSEQLQQGAGLAADAKTGEVLVADAAANRVDVYVPTPPGPPVVKVGSVSAAKVTSSSAELRATIDPTGADTHYRFQYGTQSCASAPAACIEAPSPPGGDVGQGFGDQTASVPIAGLSATTTYHVRVIAENQFAEGAAAVVSEESAFTTPSTSLGPVLPDGRAWEQVSPSNKHGAAVEPIGLANGLVQASNDGRSLTYMTTAPVGENEPEGNRGPEKSQILSTRGPGGWSSLNLNTPNARAVGIREGLAREWQFFSSDFALGLVEPPSELPLSALAGEETIYLRHNLTCGSQPASCFEPLVTPANDTAESHIANALTFRGATPDLRHVVFRSKVPLTPGAPETGMYEWTAGQLQLVTVLPGGAPVGVESVLGGSAPGEMAATAISHDGSRIVYRTSGLAEGHLYQRNVAKSETLQVDEPNTNAPTAGFHPIPDFKTASADGSKVFFTDTRRLTPDSTAGEGPLLDPKQDLYVFEPEKPAGERLTDLSVDPNSGEAAAVQGEVLGASEDGSVVYFVANGVLAAGATPGNCRTGAPSGAACNLYVLHFEGNSWGKPRFIARLSGEDAPDWGRPEGGEYILRVMTSRTTSDGHYLAFMSNRSLTGYNNVDENSGVRDEEVFLYTDGPEGGHLVCASCNPSGAQPVGVLDTEESGEGLGLVVDRPEAWTLGIEGIDPWLAANVPGWTDIGLLETLYQSRYLLNDGRLFFNSSDSLVPRAQVKGKMNVYEYEPTGVGSCQTNNTQGGCVALISSGESEHESAFVDASESGNDVFFVTASKLSPRDIDTTYDVYDARVCQLPGFEPCVSQGSGTPRPCSNEACKPPASTPPGYGTPPSATVSGANTRQSGVLSSKSMQTAKEPTRAQRLAAALKACRKKYKSKGKRTACEKSARKKYGAHSSAKHTARRRR
jgi:hypothetical protein